MFKPAVARYELTYETEANIRQAVFETMPELMRAIEVLYQLMRPDDRIRVRLGGWVEQLDGSETHALLTVFDGNERDVRKLINNQQGGN